MCCHFPWSQPLLLELGAHRTGIVPPSTKRPASAADAGELRGRWASGALRPAGTPPTQSGGPGLCPVAAGTPGEASGGQARPSSWSPHLPTAGPPGQLWSEEPCSKGFQARQGNVIIRPRDPQRTQCPLDPGVKQRRPLSAETLTPAFSITAARGGAGPPSTRGDTCPVSGPTHLSFESQGSSLWSLMSPSRVPPTPHR